MAHSPKERILDDIISGIKVDSKETERSEPADSFKTSNSHVQVPQKDSCPEPASLYPLKPQLDAKAEDGHSSVPLIPEELPTNKSRLSPLAARAALASLVSTAQTTTVSIDNQQIEGKITGQSAKRKLDELPTPARVTRSAVQKSPGNAVNDVQVKSSNEGDSKKRRRSTPSTGLEKTDDFTGSQGLENDHPVQSIKADNSEKISQTGSVLSQKKKKISPQMDLEEQTPPTKKVKAKTSNSTKKAQQAEGKSTGRKGKSTEQKPKSTSGRRDKKSASNSNQRFSHRLGFLPRTRSQVKS